MDLSVKSIALEALEGPSPFQSAFWATLKARNGWRGLAFAVESSEGSGKVLVLLRRFAPLFSIAYAPFALGFLRKPEAWSAFAKALKAHLPPDCLLLRLDVDWGMNAAAPSFHPCQASVQPTGTVRLDLTADLDFKDRVKRNLRKEEGVVVRLWDGDEEAFHQWYISYVHTALRDHFSTRSEDYLRSIFSIADKSVRPLLYLAYSDGEISGGILNLRTESEEVYLFGSSVKHTSGVSCGYALQAHAIMEAKAAGVAVYDLFGIEGEGDGEHLASLTTFKTGFGGERVYRSGTMDYIYRPFMGRIFRVIDNLRFRQARRSRI